MNGRRIRGLVFSVAAALTCVYHGQGVALEAPRDRYEGEITLSDGRRGHYEGRWGYYEDGRWSDDIPHGHGVFKMPDGTHYEGMWFLGCFQFGVETKPDGTRYEGEWSLGEKSGQGVMTSPGGWRYEGGWFEGKPHGQGVETLPDGRRYEGGWRGGERHGQGVYTDKSGKRYEGNWPKGTFHGGVYTSPDGDRVTCLPGEP